MNYTATKEDISGTPTRPISGWRKGKAAAEKLMDKGKFSIDDVKKNLDRIRSNYKD